MESFEGLFRQTPVLVFLKIYDAGQISATFDCLSSTLIAVVHLRKTHSRLDGAKQGAGINLSKTHKPEHHLAIVFLRSAHYFRANTNHLNENSCRENKTSKIAIMPICTGQRPIQGEICSCAVHF